MEVMVSQAKILAKININLLVTGRMENGYHLINSLVCPVSLYDDLSVAVKSGTGQISVETCLSDELRCHVDYCSNCDPSISHALDGLRGEKNLAHKAAAAFLPAVKLQNSVDINIKITKNIPFGAGLGGGSADAAGVLILLQQILAPEFEAEMLFNIGGMVGADVPVLMKQKLSFMAGIGNRVYDVGGCGVELIRSIGAVIVKPPCSVNTPKAYALFGLKPGLSNSIVYSSNALIVDRSRELLDEMLLETTGESKGFNFPPESLTTKGQEGRCVQPNCAGYFSSFVKGLENDFERVVALAHPEIFMVKQELTDLGANHVLLTGSGSALVCYFPGSQEAEKFIEKLEDKRGRGWFVAAVTLDPPG